MTVTDDLTAEYDELRKTVADFAQQVVAPVSAKHDAEHSFPYDVVRQMGTQPGRATRRAHAGRHHRCRACQALFHPVLPSLPGTVLYCTSYARTRTGRNKSQAICARRCDVGLHPCSLAFRFVECMTPQQGESASTVMLLR